MKPFRLVINEDNSHFFFSRLPEKMTREGLHELVDGYEGTQVSHLFFNVNCMRTSYRTAVWESIWDGNAERTDIDEGGTRWVRNAMLLDQRGLDPYKIWIDRAREKNISPWTSMRMNDVHNVHNPGDYLNSQFWRDHPEYWRNPGGNGDWTDRAFDFGLPVVREYHLRLVREILDRYDADGLELDWMRFVFHFKPGHEQRGGEALLGFMREVRGLVEQAGKRRGHPIKLGVRVPARPEAAVGLGMDAVAWARAGLIDLVIPTPFFSTSDFDIPIAQWRRLLEPCAGKVALGAGHEILIRAYPAAKHCLNNAETVRGFTAAMLGQGADLIYLFNYMDSQTTVDDPHEYRLILNEAGAMATATAKPRRHIVTYADIQTPGVPAARAMPARVGYAAFRIDTGPAPKSGGTGGAVIYIGLSAQDGLADANLSARINSTSCEALPDKTERPAVAAPAPKNANDPAQLHPLLRPGQAGLPGVERLLRFAVPLDAMVDGHNLVELKLAGGAPKEVVWVEVRVTP